jgi:hypothetical protein
VVYISLYYVKFLEAFSVNDVVIEAYYVGKITENLFYFPEGNFSSIEDPEGNWNGSYNTYKPPNDDGYQALNPTDLYDKNIYINPEF